MSQRIADFAKQICESNGIVRNSWRLGEFRCFPNETVAAVAPAAADAMDNDEDIPKSAGDQHSDADDNVC
jgi:hypothetical protein